MRQTAAGAIYRLGLALCDLNDPFRMHHRSDEWIFGPKEAYEKEKEKLAGERKS